MGNWEDLRSELSNINVFSTCTHADEQECDDSRDKYVTTTKLAPRQLPRCLK